MVRPLHECIARPAEGGRDHPLVEHLTATAAGCGALDGSALEKLAYLGGLLHDAGKAHVKWQENIGDRSVPHAPFGSYLFAYCAEQLMPLWAGDTTSADELRLAAVRWGAAVADHHGAIHDIEDEPPWLRAEACYDPVEQSEFLDLSGILELVQQSFPTFQGTPEQVKEWAPLGERIWKRSVVSTCRSHIRCLLESGGERSAIAAQLARPVPWQILVKADRYHAMEVQPVSISALDAEAALRHLEVYCAERAREARAGGAAPALLEARQQIQASCSQTFLQATSERLFSLPLPTGYGKTLTSIRVALEAARAGRAERIVYVAPYLSVLSQATSEIAEATKLEVVQHHHLSITEIEEDRALEVLDTWQSSVVTTTFNQLFKALLPRRSHHTLRAAALARAFVIVDEPQIIDVGVWNLFLQLLRAAAEESDFLVIFATATLPPQEYGLGRPARQLSPEVTPIGRFEVVYDESPLTPRDVAELAAQRIGEHHTVAVVLNTIRDAADVFELCKSHPEIDKRTVTLRSLTSMMLPAHKAQVVRKIAADLKAKKPTLVVCTQVLEAGVDLSFRCVLRALPIAPSIAQVAGRANRHCEGERAEVVVFPFRRQDGGDSREYVYRDPSARRQTDTLLHERPGWPEEDIMDILNTYYRRCTAENPNAACLELLVHAAYGMWSTVGGTEPFGADVHRVPLFISRIDFPLSDGMERLMARFAPGGLSQLLDRCQDGRWKAQLSFQDRKRFMALLHTFVVNVRPDVASECGRKINDWLWEIDDPRLYDDQLGLAGLTRAERTNESSACILI